MPKNCCKIELSDIDIELYQKLKEFEPFGMGNRRPVFMAEDAGVTDWRKVGRDGKHVKLRIKNLESRILDAIFFNGGEQIEELDLTKPLLVAFQIDENEWNGKKSLQLLIKDLRPTKN